MSDENKRPRDEEFQPEARHQAQDKATPDAFEMNKQKPLVLLAIVAVGILFAACAVLVYQVAEKKQHTIINVLPTDIADENETATSSETETTQETTEETSAEESGINTIRVNDIVYQIQDGCAIVYHCDSQSDTVQIPSTVEGYPVTEVAASAFNGCKTIYYLSIPEGVTKVGEYAFANIGEINELFLPSTLKTLEDHALDYSNVKNFISPAGCYVAQLCTKMNFTWEEGTQLPFTH